MTYSIKHEGKHNLGSYIVVIVQFLCDWEFVSEKKGGEQLYTKKYLNKYIKNRNEA